jgi:hypothetical protein
MFKPVPFEPYGSRRTRVRVPRWLTLLLTGIVVGAGGLFFVQERYLPPRLSQTESATLRAEFERAEAGRKQVTARLDDTTKKLESTLAERDKLSEQLEKERKALAPLRQDLAALVGVLPPDPRGGSVEVRGGNMTVRDGKLDYVVVLTRDGRNTKPLPAQLRFTVAGEGAKGGESQVTLDPVPVSIGTQEIARGSAALPAGFKPRQATIQVADASGGKPLGMRVLLVR